MARIADAVDAQDSDASEHFAFTASIGIGAHPTTLFCHALIRGMLHKCTLSMPSNLKSVRAKQQRHAPGP